MIPIMHLGKLPIGGESSADLNPMDPLEQARRELRARDSDKC